MKKDNGTHRIRKGILAVFVLYFSDDLDAVLFVKRKEGI